MSLEGAGTDHDDAREAEQQAGDLQAGQGLTEQGCRQHADQHGLEVDQHCREARGQLEDRERLQAEEEHHVEQREDGVGGQVVRSDGRPDRASARTTITAPPRIERRPPNRIGGALSRPTFTAAKVDPQARTSSTTAPS